MANQQLLNQSFEEINKTKTFSALSLSRQDELKKQFLQASDEQLIDLVSIFKKTQQDEVKRDAEREMKMKSIVEVAQNLESEVKEVDKRVL